MDLLDLYVSHSCSLYECFRFLILNHWVLISQCMQFMKCIRDDIKSSGKFTIFSYLKIEGGGGQRQVMEKWHLKIKTVEDIDIKMT